jgi:hypothetical protein
MKKLSLFLPGILVVVSSFFWATPAHADSIALDTTVAASYTAGASKTISITIGSGSNRILFVSATGNQGPTGTLTATYNGDAMTAIGPSIDSVGSGMPTYLFYILNPTSGTHDIVISNSAANGISAAAASYTGVKQTSPINASNTTAHNAETTHFTKDLTTTVDNSWVIMTFKTGAGSAITADAGTTVRSQPENTGLGGGALVDSGAAVTPAGSKTLGVTSANQYIGGVVIASFSPAESAAPTRRIIGSGITR